MSSIRITGAIALTALILTVGGTALASPISLGAGPTSGGQLLSVPVGGVLPDVISTGANHTVALGADGKVLAWGSNVYGQLGNNSLVNSALPVQVTLPAGVKFTQVSAGEFYSLAIGDDGKIYAWGKNNGGQLWPNSTVDSLIPVAVPVPAGVEFTRVSAGQSHSLALADDGSVYAWGGNLYGQLGVPASGAILTPQQMLVPPVGVSFTQIVAGLDVSMVVRSDGQVLAWGWNSSGQAANGTFSNSSGAPALISIPAGVQFTQVSEQVAHAAAIGDDGKIYTWGWNLYGQLGNGTTADSNLPAAIAAPPGVKFTQVSAGQYHTLALGDDEKIYVWGWNLFKSLGISGIGSAAEPSVISTLPGVRITQVSAGNRFSEAVDTDGTVYSWGNNDYGQLGNNSTTEGATPAAIYQLPVLSVLKFGGVAGTGLTRSGKFWYTDTPAHASGTVDIVGTYTRQGVIDRNVVVGRYDYGSAPVITVQPQSQTVANGSQMVLTATATGDEAPTVTWQSSADNGTTWSNINNATQTNYTTKPTATGMYRAIFSNGLGSATSDRATVIVTGSGGSGGSTQSNLSGSNTSGSGTNGSGTSGSAMSGGRDLAFTGSSSPVLPIAAALLMLLVGGGLVLMRRRRARRNDSTEVPPTSD
ncbi:MAG: immunoglobulin domain-containing protein [Rhodoglobus sp.]